MHADHSFDLERGPVLIAQILRLRPDEYALLFNLHHLVGDGWSVMIFQRELSLLYAAFNAGKPSPLPELPRRYADFAWWQRRTFARETLPAQIEWWQRKLAGRPPVLELPADRPRPEELSPRGFVSSRVFGPELTRGLRALAGSCGCSLSMAIAAGIQALISRYTGSEDVILNASFAGRNRPELAGMIGLFMNTMALRTDLSGQPGFRALLPRVRETVLAAYAHQDTPFPRLLEALFPGQRPHRTMLSRVILNMLSFSQGLASPAPGPFPRFELLGEEGTTAKYDLTITCFEGAETVHCAVLGAADIFEPQSVDAIAADLEALLAAAVADPETPLRRLLPVPRLRPAMKRETDPSF